MDESFSTFLDRLAEYLETRAQYRNRRLLAHQLKQLDAARLQAQIAFHELMAEAFAQEEDGLEDEQH